MKKSQPAKRQKFVGTKRCMQLKKRQNRVSEEYLIERGKKGSREKFDAALSQVADVEPEEQDKL